METPSQNSVRLHLEKREAFVARNTHKHPPAHTQSEQKIRGQTGSPDPSLPFQAFSFLLFTASKRAL